MIWVILAGVVVLAVLGGAVVMITGVGAGKKN